MMNVRGLLFVAMLGIVSTFGATASGATILDDQFDSFLLGTTWQLHGAGQPEHALSHVFDGTNNFLRMGSHNDVQEYRGIETISAISLAGVASLTVDARLRPLNQGIPGSLESAMVAVLGDSGAFSTAGASGPATPSGLSWGDLYYDSEGSADAQSVSFSHPGVDEFRRMIITIDATGTSLTVLNADDTVNAFSTSNANLPLASYGSSVDIALRQLKTTDPPLTFGDFDFVTVTTTAIPEPTALCLLTMGAVRFVVRRKM